MHFNWNVYKIFKNGRRAKAPIHSFTLDGDLKAAQLHFESHEIKNLDEKFGKKIRGSEFRIVNAEHRQDESIKTEEEIYQLQRNRVLAALVRERKMSTKRNYVGGLVYSQKSNWRWQWAVLEAASNNYIEGLSPQFDSYEDAQDWMKEQIEALSTGK